VLLSEFIELDTTQLAPYDTLDVKRFQYDDLNRGAISTDFQYINGVPDIHNSYTFTYHYSGTNTTPDKVIDSYQDVTTLVDTNYFSFSNAFSKDSVIETSITNGVTQVDGISVDETSANGSFVFERQAIYNASGNSLTGLELDTVSQTKIDGNVVSQTAITFPDSASFGNFGRNATFSFDNHPNPFGGSGNNTINTAHIYDIEADGIDEAPQKNNYVDINEPASNSYESTFHKKYQYTYNANGYPATVVVYDWSSGSPVFSFKGIYIYR